MASASRRRGDIRCASMIIEFFGPPAAGKTTFAHALRQRLNEHGHHADVMLSYRPGADRSSLDPGGGIAAFRRVVRGIFELTSMAARPTASKNQLGLTLKLVKALPPRSIVWFIRLSQYVLRLSYYWSMSMASVDIAIFDQAFVQVICALALYNEHATDDSLQRALAIVPKADLIIRLDAPPDIIDARLRERLWLQSPAERLFEGHIEKNLAAITIVDRVDRLLHMESGSSISLSSLDESSLSESLDKAEKMILDFRRIEVLERDRSGQDTFSESYRASHMSADIVVNYVSTFEVGYFAALWRHVEQPLLENILRPLGGPERTSLDFACGTGRIAKVAANFFSSVVGVDVSEAMLLAASVPDNVTLRCIDITEVPLEQTFDVATAFRFFLNAEDTLRRDALRAIYRHLRNGGVLVCNIQLNATSPIGLVSRVLNWVYPRRPRNTLTLDQFSRVLSDEGFEVVESVYYGYLPRPGRLFPRLCEALIEPFENVCRKLRVPGSFAESFLIVSRKR
jgi:SAM-dependent methyltransferase